MAPEDENACPGVTLSSKQYIHLRVSIIISRNHTCDDGAPKQRYCKVLRGEKEISSFNKHPLKNLNLSVCDLPQNWNGRHYCLDGILTLVECLY